MAKVNYLLDFTTKNVVMEDKSYAVANYLKDAVKIDVVITPNAANRYATHAIIGKLMKHATYAIPEKDA